MAVPLKPNVPHVVEQEIKRDYVEIQNVSQHVCIIHLYIRKLCLYMQLVQIGK